MLGISRFNEKLPILIVGKSQNPRCFKGIHVNEELGIHYYANKTSWLTKDIFRNYLHNLNTTLQNQNRKILMLWTILVFMW